MPGYSGTPLAQKLGIKDNCRAVLLRLPDDVALVRGRAFRPGTVAGCLLAHIDSSLSSRFSGLPDGLRGSSSTKITSRGTL